MSAPTKPANTKEWLRLPLLKAPTAHRSVDEGSLTISVEEAVSYKIVGADVVAQSVSLPYVCTRKHGRAHYFKLPASLK